MGLFVANSADLRAIKAVKRAIKKRGATVTLIVTTSIPNVSQPWKNSESLSEVPLLAVRTNFKSSEIDGDRVQAHDLMFIFDPDTVITDDMRVKDADNTVYSIEHVTSIKPGSTLIMQKVHCRI